MRMPAVAAWSTVLLVGFVLSACTHDLDKLRSARSSDLRDAGDAGRSGVGGREPADDGGAGSAGAGRGGSGGAGRDGGSEGGTGGSEPPPDACEPCPDLSSSAMQLELRSCCRGVGGNECGLTFGAGTLCLAGSVPGQADSACSGVTAGGMRLDGCCRPDGRCGLDASSTGLGCVAREVISEHLGSGAATAVACRYECETDAECNVVPGGFVCGEDPAGGDRFCANECARDRDCPAELEQVCAFANDFAMNRVLAICRPGVGDVLPNGTCAAAEDCVHGVCLTVENGEPYCTEFCRTSADCADDRPTCFDSNIARPDGGTPQEFSICRK
jgi:hypothetical protein